jgi:hypothetical protein
MPMDHYLKGKKTHDNTCKHMESIRNASNTRSGIPLKEVKVSEVVSKAGEPIVECITQDGRITRILITCRCGEQIELHCSY